MNVLVINCGSSSIKYRLFETDGAGEAAERARGLIERIEGDYRRGIGQIAQSLRGQGLIDGGLGAIGHRVVHGGEAFRESVVIDEAVIEQIRRCVTLAPLHNPANLAGIEACGEIFPGVVQVAVFDTAFFHTLDRAAYVYAVPYAWYEQHQVRRYGFHGTSHRYVSQQAAAFLGKELGTCNLITMHLGNGCSMAAVRGGRAVNTTMGLTPLEGLVMGTRCGDIDTAIVFHMLTAADMPVDAVRQALEKESGLMGVSAVSADMRDVWSAADGGNERARLALAIFSRRVRKYLGAYLTEVGRCDALVFTGGIGENADRMRAMIVADLEHLGIRLDAEKNRGAKPTASGVEIHDASSEVAILVVPTNEELAIARDSVALVSKTAKNKEQSAENKEVTL